MVFASYYVVDYILSIFKSGEDIEECFEIFEKLVHRYSEDRELNKVYEKFENILPMKNFEELANVKKDLEKLRDSRILMNNYNVTTPFR
jgi:hypothetical protein